MLACVYFMRDQRGQTTAEWTALVLLVSVALGALVTVGPRVDGRSFGGFIAHSIVCAVRGGGCADARGDAELARVNGRDDAALLRRFAPGLVYEPGTYTLPVDPRECRSHKCADAPDDPDLDVHTSERGGVPATAFTHVVRRNGSTYLQYWLYYPDSTSTVGNVAGAWNAVMNRASYPGFHYDDWESYQVRVDDRSGRAFARASAHHGYQGCKQRVCANQWTELTGWSRVSHGSHAGHIPLDQHGGRLTFSLRDGFGVTPRTYTPRYPGVNVRERTTTAAGLRLLPVESLPEDMQFAISPPWQKEVYRDPSSNSTG
jgi:Flp pilus assembly pilin Flp